MEAEEADERHNQRPRGAPAWLSLPLLALVGASALWGASVSGTKYAPQGFGPVTLLCIELVAAAGGLWIALLVQGYRPPPSWCLAAFLGLLEPGLAYLGDTFGLAHTTAANGSVISDLESALVVVLAAVLLGEAVTRPAIVAVVVAFGGLVVLAGGSSGHRATTGDLCVAAGALSASLYTVIAKRCDDGTSALSLTAWQFGAAALLSVSGAMIRWTAGSERPPLDVAPRFWLAAIVVGVFGLLTAIAFLGESPTISESIGAVLIAVSVTYVSVSDRRSARQAPPAGATSG